MIMILLLVWYTSNIYLVYLNKDYLKTVFFLTSLNLYLDALAYSISTVTLQYLYIISIVPLYFFGNGMHSIKKDLFPKCG